MIRYVIILAAFCLLILAWVLVQMIWRKSFSEYINDEDVLAARGSCSGCGCMGGVCERKGDKLETRTD